MVRLINKDNVWILKKGIVAWMNFQRNLTHIVGINEPKPEEIPSCIYALWHENQCCAYGFRVRENTSIMISQSLDGEIITAGVEAMGLKVVRGSSQKKGAATATMQLIERLNEGEDAALTIDGPSGPLHKVKNGVIKIAKLSGKPIIPVTWYCPQKCFLTLPSWDKMKLPVWDAKIINLYGEPIYIPSDLPNDEYEPYRQKIEEVLDELDRQAPEEYKKAKEQKLWDKLNK